MHHTEDEALAFIVDTRMTKDSYHKIRRGAIKRSANIYSSYDRIRLAKERCYSESIELSEEKASVSLQHLLDHTLSRLLYETFEFNNSIYFEEVYTEFYFFM